MDGARAMRAYYFMLCTNHGVQLALFLTSIAVDSSTMDGARAMRAYCFVLCTNHGVQLALFLTSIAVDSSTMDGARAMRATVLCSARIMEYKLLYS